MDFLCEDKTVRCIYFGVLLLLILYIVWLQWQDIREAYMGKGFAIRGYENFSGPSARGPTARRLGQEFSQPNQGEHGVTYIDEIREHVPAREQVPASPAEGGAAPKEALVNNQGEPDFWEIGNVLAAYRRRQSPSYRGDIETEHLEEGSPAAQVEEELLRMQLYN